MERPHIFTLGDNNKIAEAHSRNLKIFSSWTIGPILIYMYKIITLLKCIHWFELVSQVGDVTHGPLVFSALEKGLGLNFKFSNNKRKTYSSPHIYYLTFSQWNKRKHFNSELSWIYSTNAVAIASIFLENDFERIITSFYYFIHHFSFQRSVATCLYL